MHDIKIGTTDRSILIFIPDPASTDGSGKTTLVAANLTVSYTRMETDNDATVTDVTSSLNDLGSLTTTHADWGLKEISSTLAPGLYRLDIADAVFAAGAWEAVVYVMITSSQAAATPWKCKLVAYDPGELVLAQLSDNVTHGGSGAAIVVNSITTGDLSITDTLSANAWSIATTTTFTGAVTASNASNNIVGIDVAKISGDATAADNAEAFFDGTGYAGTGNVIPTVTAVTAISSGGITEASFATTAGSFHPLGIIDQGTAQAATGTTLQIRSAAAFANDELLGAWILITGGTTGVGQVRRITDYVASTDTATVDTWTTTPSGTITYKIFAAPPVIDVNVSHVGGTAGSVGVFPSGSITSNVLATGCIGADQLAADAIGASELATDAVTEIVDAVWANATRTLSAATNITSTGGTTVPQTGDAYARLGAPAGASVSADVAAVKVDTAATVVDTNELQTDWTNGGRLDLLIDGIIADLPTRVTKNTALAGFTFFMVDSADHVTGKTGLTITATRSLDGAAFASCTNSATEISSGWYKIDLAAGDLNGNTVALRFTGTGADSRNITLITQPT